GCLRWRSGVLVRRLRTAGLRVRSRRLRRGGGGAGGLCERLGGRVGGAPRGRTQQHDKQKTGEQTEARGGGLRRHERFLSGSSRCRLFSGERLGQRTLALNWN